MQMAVKKRAVQVFMGVRDYNSNGIYNILVNVQAYMSGKSGKQTAALHKKQ